MNCKISSLTNTLKSTTLCDKLGLLKYSEGFGKLKAWHLDLNQTKSLQPSKQLCEAELEHSSALGLCYYLNVLMQITHYSVNYCEVSEGVILDAACSPS